MRVHLSHLLSVLFLLLTLLSTDAFLHVKHATCRPSLHALTRRPSLAPLFDSEPSYDDKTSPKRHFPPVDLILKPSIDLPSIVALVQGQAILLLVVLALQSLMGFQVLAWDGLRATNESTLTSALALSLPIILAGIVFDNLPWEFAKKVQLDTKVFSLRLLGRATPPAVAAGVAALLSASTAVAEEVFFRGLIFEAIYTYSDIPTAIVGSSILFGIAHSPFTFGGSVIVEAVIGAHV